MELERIKQKSLDIKITMSVHEAELLAKELERLRKNLTACEETRTFEFHLKELLK